MIRRLLRMVLARVVANATPLAVQDVKLLFEALEQSCKKGVRCSFGTDGIAKSGSPPLCIPSTWNAAAEAMRARTCKNCPIFKHWRGTHGLGGAGH